MGRIELAAKYLLAPLIYRFPPCGLQPAGLAIYLGYLLQRCSVPGEKAFAVRMGVTIHRPSGENFLWGYSDIQRYLAGREVSVEALSIEGLMNYSRVPGRASARLRPLASEIYAWYRLQPSGRGAHKEGLTRMPPPA